ncbi:uncharacterized protein LOC118467434 [Anopheles albimanus]|uniref:Uncharacterized protein n=1 Tax=Anopheles albimanus TaxID=7167 RepID=A0A182FU24_ANOAL|nr:uncharacterized protein LOC118467434 [Anopheles albimanus]
MDGSNCFDALCRICSSPGSHSIFTRIPAFLHDHYREYARWKQPIYLLIVEVTGVEITNNDALPKKICELCISYLKHAYTFRRQALDNIAGLLAAKYLSSHHHKAQEKDKQLPKVAGIESSHDIIPLEGPLAAPADGGAYRNVNLASSTDLSGQSALKQPKKKMMHRFVAKKPPNNNAEEVPEFLGKLAVGDGTGIFGYREKVFVEDDVMELDGLGEHGITFTLPEDYKEKKCFACRKRFMFSETYTEHLNECLLYKLTDAISSLRDMLALKEQSAISTFDFMRRVVFTIRKCYQLVRSYDGEVGEGPMLDLPDGTAEEESAVDGLVPSMLDSLSESDSSNSLSTVKPLARTAYPYESRSMNNGAFSMLPPSIASTAMQLPIVSAPRKPHVPPTAAFHSNLEIIKNRLTKTEAEEVNENSGSAQTYKTIKCKKCDARFVTISHLDEHTKKVHQSKVRTLI